MRRPLRKCVVCKHDKSTHTYVGTTGGPPAECQVPGCKCSSYQPWVKDRAARKEILARAATFVRALDREAKQYTVGE